MRQPQVDYFILGGGLDLVSPAVSLKSGAATEALNYEPSIDEGYSRISGAERTDGRAAPSDANYYFMSLNDIGSIVVGDTLTGVTSGATSVIVAVNGNDIGVTNLSGSYTLSETANGQIVTVTETLQGQTDEGLDPVWNLAAQDYYRDLIQKPTGEGTVLGAVQHLDKKYCFRNNVGSTAAVMYESSASGWVAVTLNSILVFDTGILSEGDIVPGDTITGATSGATATVLKFIKHGGSYSADAFGYMVIDVTSGAFVDNELIQESAATRMTADGADYAITIDPNGLYEFASYNFFATDGTFNLYGCDGVNPAFEFDGTTYTPILMNSQAEDVPEFNKPSHIEVHKDHLFLAFDNGSVQHSEPGLPLHWSAFLGAAEFGLGSDINGMASRTGGVLAIYSERNTKGLYGNNVSDWALRTISETAGARAHTVQNLVNTYSFDEFGLNRLDRTEAFGDFDASTVSRKIRPLLKEYKDRMVGSVIIRNKNQYRLFFNDGRGLIMMDDSPYSNSGIEFTLFEMPFIPHMISNGEDENGNEVVLVAATDGFVYELEKGNSWDGEEMEYALRLAYNHAKSPRNRKTYKHIGFDIKGDRAVTLRVSTELTYGTPYAPTDPGSDINFFGGGGYWNVSNWLEFYWDGQSVSSRRISITGTGNNLGILLYGKSATTRPFTLQAAFIHYLMGRLDRG